MELCGGAELEPIQRERVPFTPEDPLKLQICHFCDVIEHDATPLVSSRDGLNTLKVVEAVKEAARTGGMVKIGWAERDPCTLRS